MERAHLVVMKVCFALGILALSSAVVGGAISNQVAQLPRESPSSSEISQERMRAIYEEVKTPYKYGIVLEPSAGKKVDCPNVFRYEGRWYMTYVQFENNPPGYTTQLAESDDLLHWKSLGTILPRGRPGTWDSANAGGGVALFDTDWGGCNELQRFKNRYWLSYMGGPNPGYEKPPLSIGIVITTDPSKTNNWRRFPLPVLCHSDTNARPFEAASLYDSCVFFDPSNSLGAPFVMVYNARSPNGDENIGLAVSKYLKVWKRIGDEPVVANVRPQGLKRGVISGSPQVVRINDLWVMFYYGAFWKPGTFNTFAASRDLTNWTKWDGEALIQPSEPWDTPTAYKPWVIKHNGVVYHFYGAVSGRGKEQTCAIALATSKDLRPSVAPTK